MSKEHIEKALDENYLRWRLLEDGTYIALGDLMFTRAIYVDCTDWGYARRYCFENRELANNEFDRLKSGDEEPVGFIANRGA
jgi:hypothetical protein